MGLNRVLSAALWTWRKRMLILTRRPGEALIIGDDIVVQVLDVRGNQVRIGVEAPRDVAVDREELRERKEANRAPPR